MYDSRGKQDNQDKDMDMDDYKIIIEYNSDRIVSYLPNGLFPQGILEDSKYFPKIAYRLKNLEEPAHIEFYHKSQQWRDLESEKDYCQAAVTLLTNHILFISIKEQDHLEKIGTKGENVMVPRELLTSLSKQIAQLEISLRKDKLEKSVRDVYFDIDPDNEELYNFYSQIDSAYKLEDIMKDYKKYHEWINKFNSDEKYLENQLETMAIFAKHPVIPTLSKPAMSRIEDNSNNPFTLTLYQKDLNFCFKLKNNTGVYYPNNLNIVTNLEDGTHTISVQHGIGPHNHRTFTRFKKDFGSECKISDFMYFQIKDSNEKSPLYEGIRSKFDNEQAVFKLRSVNHPALNGTNLEKLQNNEPTPTNNQQSALSSIDGADIISTTISSNINETNSTPTFDDYDFLSETEFEDY